MKLRQTQLISRPTNVFILQGSSKESHLSQYCKESQHSYCSPFLGILIYILNTYSHICFCSFLSCNISWRCTNLDPQEPRHRHCDEYHQHDSIPLAAYDSKQSCFHKSPLDRIHIKEPGPPSGPGKEDLSAINIVLSKWSSRITTSEWATLPIRPESFAFLYHRRISTSPLCWSQVDLHWSTHISMKEWMNVSSGMPSLAGRRAEQRD